MQKITGGQRLVLKTSFCFFNKSLCTLKTSGQHLHFNFFGRLPLGHAIKTNFVTFQVVDLDLCSILIYYKMV